MSDNRKYYYLKLKENFYNSETMVILESMQDGLLYSNLLLKMYLMSLKSGGILMLNDHLPHTPQTIATFTRHQVGTVERALKVFLEFGLVEILTDGAYYMADIQLLIGQSSTEGERKKKERMRLKRQKLLPSGGVDICPPYSQGDICPPEIRDKRLDIRDKSIQNWKFQRGDIFFTRFDNAIGSEQSGNRPAVVLQNDVGNFYSPTLIVATLTSKAAKKYTQPTHCLLVNEFLSVPSIVQAEQIFTVDKSRVLKFLGHLTPEEMSRVDDAVRASLALNPMGSIQRLPPIIRSTAAYAPPEVVDGKPPIYPYTPIKSSFEDAGSVEDMMLYTELEAAVHAMIQRLEYSFTFNPSLLTIPKRKQQVAEILKEAETYIWRIKEEMRCA